MTDQSWIERQTAQMIAQWDRTLNDRYPETAAWSDSPAEYVTHLTRICNYLNAAAQIDFAAYLPNHATVMDLGCGGGWLTAHLSTMAKIDTIYALDSSGRYLEALVPKVADIMGGERNKVVPIHGVFSPILLPDDSLDAVAASSVLHHADNLESMLREIRRVLKPDGTLFILNECPMTSVQHLKAVSKVFVKMFLALSRKTYVANPQSISAGAYLEEPYLGDRCYPKWYWQQAIQRADLRIERVVDSGMATVPGSGGLHLTHFVCKPA
jgi:ubiquinone/menaquinone biosynthesis C-methylase UbiE